MEKQSLRENLLKAIKGQKDESGWANLVNVGSHLKTNGIDYKALGYEKLIHLIKENSDCLIWKTDNITPKVTIFFVKEKNAQEKLKYNNVKKAQQLGSFTDPSNALTSWASLGDFSKAFEELSKLALPERWYYEKLDSNQPYPILIKYLKYTFYRLSQEKDKIVEKDTCAAFNTGLVDRRYEPIYAFFSKTPNALRKWKLIR